MEDDRWPAFRGEPTVEQGSEHVRDRLGTVVTDVADTGGAVVLTDAGTPDGAIVHRDVLAQAGLDIAAEWGVRQARAAEIGPQGITYRGSLAGVLVDQATAAALACGLPVLLFEELELAPGGTTLANDSPSTDDSNSYARS
ncbi:hypothetical protein [Allosalinactinospora lopnorensis]|uniref:hypothetical protein n=1 Tax=Allosalinactinospora lopnorensis TaxID=1352348 RepID=UPI0012E2B95C|nr:hypothetical protein [Allosalinactinospora lopnorensis]